VLASRLPVPPTATNSNLLAKYVALHNRSVTDHDFEEMMTLFSDDAVLKFEGSFEMIFEGKSAIANAFARMPPTEHIYTQEAAESPSSTMALYGCNSAPEQVEGVIDIKTENGLITALTITTYPEPKGANEKTDA
jgi:hypothetical protein